MKEALPLPPPQYLHRIFEYEQDTGKLIWRYRPETNDSWNARYAGTEAGCRKKSGNFVRIDETCYKTARIIWKWMTGEDPIGEIDHKDTDHFNNRWNNLRDSTRQQNGCNRRPYARSGMPKGVYLSSSGKRYQARIGVNYRAIYLGNFGSIEEAVAAYNAAACNLHGEFARTNSCG